MQPELCGAGELLGWLHEMGWYRAWMRSAWFRPYRPTWEEYHLDWALLGLVALLALLVLVWIVRRLRPRGGWLRGDERSARRSALRTAEQLLAQGELLLAAEAFVRAEEPGRAIETFLAAGAHARAAEVAERSGALDLAADLYLKAMDEAGRIRVLVRAGRLDEAVQILVRAQRVPDAAELLLQAGRVLEAARALDGAGLHSRAAELFRQADQPLLAAEALLRLLATAHGGFTGDEQEMMIAAAEVLARAGRRREAADLLLAGGRPAEAARLFEKLGERGRAAAAWERAGDLERAFALTEDPQRRLALLEEQQRRGRAVPEAAWAEALAAAGRSDKAAARLLEGGDLEAALATHRAAGNLGEAASLLARAGRHLEAGRTFEAAADLEAAQEQYLLAGALVEAARVAEAAGNHLDAGARWLELGQAARAIAALQRVAGDAPRAGEAQALLARAFEGLGDTGMARRTYERLLAGQQVSPRNLEVFYHYACFLAGSGAPGDAGEARRLFQEILGVDYNFRDVRGRLQRLGGGEVSKT